MIVHALDIFLGDRAVGTITNLPNDLNVFVFDPTYVEDPNRPVLSLGFLDADGQLKVNARTPHTRLLPFFSNLLPEAHLREYLAARAHVNPQRDFPLLWLVGEDLPGAVIARHSAGVVAPPTEPAVVALAIEADPSVLKFSLAGVQLKFSAVSEAAGGLTIPVYGQGGDWVVKLPSATYAHVPENELTMLSFARDVGIDVPEVRLVDASAIGNLPQGMRDDLGSALAIRRFDRQAGRRIHIEDFAQIFNQFPRDKYRNVSYGNMLAGIWRTMGEAGAQEFVRRLIFSIAIGNADMHLKNWSVIYRDGRTPALAPAYDYLSTILYIPNDVSALAIVGERNWAQVDRDLLTRFARKAGVPRGIVLTAAADMTDRLRGQWPSLNHMGLLDARAIDQLDAHFASVPLFRATKSTSGVALPATAADPPVEIA